jgi:acyl-coenzyme A synthetase/AMP-(fatty) acid ligase
MAKVLRPHPFNPPEIGGDEKVCYSGDLVTMDEDGFLYFVGRRDNMIRSSGVRISPTEVEKVLFQSGMLREAAVIGVPDGALGHVIKAYVTPREGEAVTPDALLAFGVERVPRYMVPKMVEILDALPKMANGKVDYPALRRREGIP